jgi:hypothetical protein
VTKSKDNIKDYFEEIECSVMLWIQLAKKEDKQ